ncbi:MAG TPA: Crp/Fnr family transcriptional regulator [Vicinamibacterales bacterium]|nr:Crp/Fnr family transcriptional regulator [Vicinamibacterales bacterium]
MKTDNLVLARLPRAERARLQPHMKLVDLHFKEGIHEQGKPIDFVYFPIRGLVSVVTDLRDGGTIETGTIGREGLVGVSAVLGPSPSPGRAFVQVPGAGYRLPASKLLDHLKQGGELQTLALKVANAQMATVAQTAACNRAHTLEERMARWLLLTRDRMDDDEFPLTQEFLSHMLGVRRPTVSLGGATLQKAGLIRYSRGHITIVDRKGLEQVSCECYSAIRDRYEKSL